MTLLRLENNKTRKSKSGCVGKPAGRTDLPSDISERPINRSKTVPGAFYQSVKQEITLQQDEYIVERRIEELWDF